MLRRLEFEKRYLLRDAPWDTGQTPPEVLAWLEGRTPGRAIDIGCGTGTNALTLARLGWQVTAVDFSRLAVRAARRKAAAAGLTLDLRQADASRLEGIDGPFDLALDIGCFHSLTPAGRRLYARRLPELLRPGATYILYTFLDHPDARREWPSRSEIEDAFRPSFSLVQSELGLDRDQPSAYLTWERTG
ncbi:MAG TPA: methyltransferase domain-containing protein [Anaerolineales bacterium]|nr:methyltransferase domain-containing protein [Anaerolineales bacterium]